MQRRSKENELPPENGCCLLRDLPLLYKMHFSNNLLSLIVFTPKFWKRSMEGLLEVFGRSILLATLFLGCWLRCSDYFNKYKWILCYCFKTLKLFLFYCSYIIISQLIWIYATCYYHIGNVGTKDIEMFTKLFASNIWSRFRPSITATFHIRVF